MRWLATWLLLCGVACGQVHLNGANDYVAIANTGVTVPITLMGWCELTSTNQPAFSNIIRGNALNVSAAPFWLRIRYDGGFIDYGYGDSVGSSYNIQRATNLTFVGLHHYAATHDGTNAHLYVDGIEVASYTAFGSMLDDKSGCIETANTIGADIQNSRYLIGDVSDVRIYSSALTAKEVAIIANPKTAYELIDPDSLVLRTCINSGDTGSTLTGIARNYGTGADGTYSNSPTVPPFKIQIIPPMEEDQP